MAALFCGELFVWGILFFLAKHEGRGGRGFLRGDWGHYPFFGRRVFVGRKKR
jgi:hypothetical protein